MSDEQQKAMSDITVAVMNLLDEWELSSAQIQTVLRLSSKKYGTRSFVKMREGREVLPSDDVDVMRRTKYLLRIADALRTMYPRNPKMSGRWIKQRLRRFGGRTPLQMILDEPDGDGALVAVLSELDCTFSWDLTGSKPMASR